MSGRQSRDAQNHVLTRVHQDRCLANQDSSLYEYLGQQPCEGTYAVEVFADARVERVAREAWLSVRITHVEVRCPNNLSTQDYPPSVRLYAVEAKEVNPPAGQPPIHWRLLTTHEVVCLEQAL